MSSILFPSLDVPPQSYVSNGLAPSTWLDPFDHAAPHAHAPYTPRTTPPALGTSPTSSGDYFSRKPSSYSAAYGVEAAAINPHAHTHPLPTPISPESQPADMGDVAGPAAATASSSARAARFAALGLPTDLARPFPAYLVEEWESLPDLLRQPLKKDGGPPRPMNAYFIFMRVRRPRIAEANPTLTTGQISSLLGKEWGSLGQDDKTIYNDLADRHLRAFKKRFPDYQYERASKKKPKAGTAAAAGARVVSRSHRGVGSVEVQPVVYDKHMAVRHSPYGHPVAAAAYPQTAYPAHIGHGYPQHAYYYPQQVYQPAAWEHQVQYDPRTVSQHYYTGWAQPQPQRHVSAYTTFDASSPESY